jgi:hypothetical protein
MYVPLDAERVFLVSELSRRLPRSSYQSPV